MAFDADARLMIVMEDGLYYTADLQGNLIPHYDLHDHLSPSATSDSASTGPEAYIKDVKFDEEHFVVLTSSGEFLLLSLSDEKRSGPMAFAPFGQPPALNDPTSQSPLIRATEFDAAHYAWTVHRSALGGEDQSLLLVVATSGTIFTVSTASAEDQVRAVDFGHDRRLPCLPENR